MNTLLHTWHTKLGMPKYDLAWHETDMADELEEYHEATGFIATWSELSDVAYTYTRAVWSSHTTIIFPFNTLYLYLGVLYMIPKYTLRWRFFKKLGDVCQASVLIAEVRNPKKEHKMKAIAEKYNIDPELFQSEANKLRRRSFFLP